VLYFQFSRLPERHHTVTAVKMITKKRRATWRRPTFAWRRVRRAASFKTWAVVRLVSFVYPLAFASRWVSSKRACAVQDRTIHHQDRNRNIGNHLHLLRVAIHSTRSDISTLRPSPNTETTETRCALSYIRNAVRSSNQVDLGETVVGGPSSSRPQSFARGPRIWYG
jgi:hypothetical protein